MTTIDKQEDGMMDIGEHCSICRQLDFLPFNCEKCGKSFCSNHRNDYNLHKCIINEQTLKLKELESKKVDVSKLPKASSLFPDLNKIRKDAQDKYEIERTKNIGQRLTNERGPSNNQLTSVEVAMLRLKKLLGNTQKKTVTTSKSIFGFKKTTTGSSSSSAVAATSTKATKMIEMNTLRRTAIGDSRISTNNRVYVWVMFTSDDDTKFSNKKAQFFSKNWPIGKMLDNSAELSNIKNLNNKDIDSSFKLAMFRQRREDEKVVDSGDKNNKNKDAVENNKDEDVIYIPTNGRVEREIKDGDVIYILRGRR